MPAILSEPATAVYLILFAFVLVTGAMAARNQDRSSLVRCGLAIAVLLIVYLLDRTNESPYEQAVRRINAMAQAADSKNPDAFVEHVADSVEYRGSDRPTRLTKAELKASPFWDLLRHNSVRVAVWNFEKDPEKQTDDAIDIRFGAKGESGGTLVLLDMVATFRKQPDGTWKLEGFASYKHQSKELFPIPNLGR